VRVRVRVRVRVGVHVSVSVSLSVRVSACVLVCVYCVSVHVRKFVCVCAVYVCLPACTRACVCACVWMCVSVCVYVCADLKTGMEKNSWCDMEFPDPDDIMHFFVTLKPDEVTGASFMSNFFRLPLSLPTAVTHPSPTSYTTLLNNSALDREKGMGGGGGDRGGRWGVFAHIEWVAYYMCVCCV